MIQRIVLVVAVLMLMVGAASAQISGGGDTKRRTVAITYPPRDKHKIYLSGTTRTPRFTGEGNVQTVRGAKQIELDINNMVPAYMLGADYTTYILWAITPEGQIESVGELRLGGSKAKFRGTTKFDTFALIVTAEPHFAVSRPSRMVVAENIPPRGPVAIQSAEIFFQGDSGSYYRDDQLPELATKEAAKRPIELLGASRAIEIAKRAGAERYARADLDDAINSYAKAEQYYLSGERPSSELLARTAIREAERARELAEERTEAARRRDEKKQYDDALAERDREQQDMLDRIEDLTAELRVSEGGRRRAEDEAERAHGEAADLRVHIRTLEAQNEQLRDQLQELESRLGMVEREREAERVSAQRNQAFQSLNEMLSPVATVREDPRGFKVVLPDSLFNANGSLKATASSKLNPIAGVLLGQPGVSFMIEGYLDDRGQPDAILQSSQVRAQAIADFLVAAGISSDRFKVTGYGSANPLASNKTLKGRTANRRVELVFIRP
jgi:outer membrane protein OmpA-like peptidoglycan-associated protein